MAAVLARFGPVDVVTTGFDHVRKRHKPPEIWPVARRVAQLPTPAYPRNVSVRRFWSHLVFARRALHFAAAHAAEYDVVYATAPLSSLASAAFARLSHAVRILDVVDVWPDVLPFPPVVRRFGAPAFHAWKAHFAEACRRADVLLAVSDAFLDEGRRWFRGDAERAQRFYIGHPAFPSTGGARVDSGRRRVAYVGNIGTLYDFDTLLDALDAPELRGTYQLDVIGGGDRDRWLRGELRRRGLAHHHWGVVHAPEVLGPILGQCHVGFNGYRNTSAAFSYKATTYLAAGLPLLNSMGGDLATLVRDRQLGANYAEGDCDSLRGAIAGLGSQDQGAVRARCRTFFAEELESARVDAQLQEFLTSVLGARPQP
jgi:glycosyltransferase involved in cell wall biosynthesis